MPLKDSYLELAFDANHEVAGGNQHVGGNRIRLVSLGPFALFGDYKLTSSSENK